MLFLIGGLLQFNLVAAGMGWWLSGHCCVSVYCRREITTNYCSLGSYNFCSKLKEILFFFLFCHSFLVKASFSLSASDNLQVVWNSFKFIWIFYLTFSYINFSTSTVLKKEKNQPIQNFTFYSLYFQNNNWLYHLHSIECPLPIYASPGTFSIYWDLGSRDLVHLYNS